MDKFKLIDKSTFIRAFKVVSQSSYDIFLGSGGSIAAGIPSGGELVWYFKKEILIGEKKIDGKKITDLRIDSNKKLIQSYFDSENEKSIKNLYSHYFELCYPNAQVREDFLAELIKDKKPTLGHLCIAALVEKKKVHTIWTTNFDDLVEKAISSMHVSCTPVSTKDASSVHRYRKDIPKIVKLHGDFKYNALQNTDSELQQLEINLSSYFIENSTQKGLIVVGYSGSDTSVLNTLKDALKQDNPFPRGLIWCLRKGEMPSCELISIINSADEKNQCSGFMYIDTFDYFLHELYTSSEIDNITIDNIANSTFEQRKSFNLILSPSKSPILLNAIKANVFPRSFFVAKTDLQNWGDLREITKGKSVVGALSKGYTYLLGEEGVIKDILKNRSSTSIEIKDVPERFYYIKESFYIGLLYDFIAKSLVKQHGFSLYQKGGHLRKIFSKKHQISNSEIDVLKNRKITLPSNINVFEAFEYKIEFVNKELFFLISPCVHIVNVGERELRKEDVQYLSNAIYSNRYNGIYGDKLKFWFKLLSDGNSSISFKLGYFEIKLSSYYSTASITQKNIYCFDRHNIIKEPFIFFHNNDLSKKSIHPINGLKLMGTLENSNSNAGTLSTIRLGIIAPESGFNNLIHHLNKLQTSSSPIWEKDYLKEYPGFQQLYNKQLIIPNSKTDQDVILILENEVKNLSAIQFYDVIKKKVDKLAERFSELDCVVIYIPEKWVGFRETKTSDVYYDLHDSLKIYCVKKNLKVQFIEDKSIRYKDTAKVMWWLSLGIYVKANGTPWKITSEDNCTAFVGLGYAIKRNAKNKVVLGSSQIFDGNGTGLKFLLQPIEKPVYYNKNPFMSKEDAFRLISNIRNVYNRIDPISGLNKIVIHKTTPFTTEEIEGIKNALAGVDNIELVQVQQLCDWKALKLIRQADGKHKFDGYPIERGTIIQLDEYSFLLWTHGVVDSPEFVKPYYQGKRGIPVPLLIKRFLGTDSIENVASDILKFTKMNWNGAELYKTLPVTIDFSKKLSVMGKQIEDLGIKPYDFRYFL